MSTRRRTRGLAYVAPLVVFMALMFLVPLVELFVLSLRPVDEVNTVQPGFTLGQYERVFTESYFYGALGETLLTAVLVTALCLLLAYPVGYLLARRRAGLTRTLLFVVVISPLLTSVVVRSYGWVVLLAGNGPVNRFLMAIGLLDKPAQLLSSYPAVLVSVTHVLLPFAILPVTTALGALDRDLNKASANLGAGPWRTFWRITVPLSLPGAITGALIVFALAMGIYVTPLLVGGVNQPLAGIRVYDQVQTVFDYPVAAALSFVLLVLTIASTSVLNLVSRRWERAVHG